jgi:hypothetical protein
MAILLRSGCNYYLVPGNKQQKFYPTLSRHYSPTKRERRNGSLEAEREELNTALTCESVPCLYYFAFGSVTSRSVLIASTAVGTPLYCER